MSITAYLIDGYEVARVTQFPDQASLDRNQEHARSTTDDTWWWITDRPTFCPDCGKLDEIRGHMDCQFPTDAA